MKKFFQNMLNSQKRTAHNTSMRAHVADRLSHVRRKMSRGAANIFRMMKVHAKWGNKQLWGSREKGRHKKSE